MESMFDRLGPDAEANRLAFVRAAINDRTHWVAATDDEGVARLMAAAVRVSAALEPDGEHRLTECCVAIAGTGEAHRLWLMTTPKSRRTRDQFRALARGLSDGASDIGDDPRQDLACISFDPDLVVSLVSAIADGHVGPAGRMAANN